MTKRRSPGDGSLTKRKSDGLWIGSVEIPSLDGKRRQRRVFSKNRNEAIRKLKQLRADVDAGPDGVAAPKQGHRLHRD